MATWLRESAHRILYTTANSAAMNPYITESGITSKTVKVTPWWEPTLISLAVLFALLAAGGAFMLAWTIVRSRRGKDAAA